MQALSLPWNGVKQVSTHISSAPDQKMQGCTHWMKSGVSSQVEMI